MNVIREIVVTYCKNPNFEPTGENIITWECDEVEYHVPTAPLPLQYMANNIPIGPTPPIYNLIRNDTGECLQITPYQMISIYYKQGYPERVASAIQTAMDYRKDVLERTNKMEEQRKLEEDKQTNTNMSSYVQ